MKTCSKCKIEKDESEFSKRKKNKDGLDYRCRACKREDRHTDAYKNIHRESQKAYQQTDAFKEARKAYQQTDAYKAYQQAYNLRRKAAASAGNAGQSSDTKTLP